MPESQAVMLPGDVRPVSYDLTLTPDLERFTFRGDETIEIEVLEPTDRIVLNCTEIDIQSCRVTLADGNALAPDNTRMDQAEETATFWFGATLPRGIARLHINFSGQLNDRLRGFYRSSYTDPNGEERYLATTQFEATDARRAFPCWDEPSLKARFRITLVIPADLVAISNMEVERETREKPGLKAVRFSETPVMSTYVLAFVVGDIRSIQQRAGDGTLVRVWATPGAEAQGQFALETSVKLLDYFNDYFGIPYPLDKLDHVAIPDFAAGAMENWGLITYRERALLVDPDKSSTRTRQGVAAIVSHEVAHMWFGDLVTMSWWNDLWLNESFASWMGDKAVDHLFPEWRVWTQFLSADTNQALSLDGLKNSHPIEQTVNHPTEIQELFDEISYSKGASIIRMLEQFLGPEVFRQGLHEYLADHEYANARTHDLWNALAKASGQPVAEVMDTWTNQTGYPVLDVETRRENNAVEVSFTQRRFVYEDILGQKDRGGTLWRVPAKVSIAGVNKAASVLMNGPTATVTVESTTSPAWIKVNPSHTGFYRVNYQRDDWDRLAQAIEGGEMSADDRLGLQNDAYALSRAGLLPVSRFFEFVRVYSHETDASVCADLAVNLASADTLLNSEPYYTSFQGFARDIFKPIGERMGWDPTKGEGDMDAVLRGTVLAQLGHYEDEQTLAEASARFARYLEDSSSVNPDIRPAVFVLAARRGDRTTYDKLWELHNGEKLQEEKLRLVTALTQFRQMELLQETLERSLSEEVRSQDAIGVVIGVGSNRHGRELAWRFLKENWKEYYRRYGEGGFGIMRLVSIVSAFNTEAQRRDVEEFFKANPAPAVERSIRQSLERIQLNIAWLERNRDDLAAWFG